MHLNIHSMQAPSNERENRTITQATEIDKGECQGYTSGIGSSAYQ